jgi:NAD(P)-dependent dehydrogenase (short-subunit alcohol dehydrogenase family)
MGAKVYANCYSDKGAAGLKQACKGGSLETLVFDVRDESEIRKAREMIQNKENSIYALINNAGIASHCLVEGTASSDLKSVMDINFHAVAMLCKEFLPLLRKFGRGSRIINISSVAGRVAGGGLAPYSASKFAVEGFSDSLRRELFPFGVFVSLIEPGFFKTAIISDIDAKVIKSFENMSPEAQLAYKNFHSNVKSTTKAIHKMAEDPLIVVNAIVRSTYAKSPILRYLVGWQASLLYVLLSQAPTNVADLIIRFIM